MPGSGHGVRGQATKPLEAPVTITILFTAKFLDIKSVF